MNNMHAIRYELFFQDYSVFDECITEHVYIVEDTLLLPFAFLIFPQRLFFKLQQHTVIRPVTSTIVLI